MANPTVGILVVVPLLVLIAVLEGLTALPAASGRFVRARRTLFWMVVLLLIPFVLVVVGRFYYLR